ncbi:hypothetical protein, partial [Streptomyces mirabilis]|uniref:hypothetical protein n=1 Tax=Streptomyces mirabilis TaxID=68239 RepID=UPI00369D6E1F
MSVSTSVAVGDPFQRYAVEVAGTLPGPGLSPSVAAVGMSSSHGARTGSSGTGSGRAAGGTTPPPPAQRRPGRTGTRAERWR